MKPIVLPTPRGDRIIGPGSRPWLIAEVSANHQQRFERALAIIDAAIGAGVDAIKLQTYTADTMTIDSPESYFQIEHPLWGEQTYYQLYQQAHTPWEWHAELKRYAEERGVVLFSSPFDSTAVDFLESLQVALYKVASFELVDIPLLKAIGRTKKPVIMSRGLASDEEIREAIATLRAAGSSDIVVLHCVSAYPAPPEEMALATIADIPRRYGVQAGLSDHTLNPSISMMATTLGATVIEKHVTMARADGGADAAFSLEPEEIRAWVSSVALAHQALGAPRYTLAPSEQASRVFRKSIFVVSDVQPGEPLTAANTRVIRPGHGLPPKFYEAILGRRARIAIKRGTPLDWPLLLDA